MLSAKLLDTCAEFNRSTGEIVGGYYEVKSKTIRGLKTKIDKMIDQMGNGRAFNMFVVYHTVEDIASGYPKYSTFRRQCSGRWV